MMLLDMHITYNDKGYTLFNDYRYKRMAEQDAKTITKYDTLILQSKSGTYYLYQSNDERAK